MYQHIDFTKTGGFPLTQDAMAFLQNSYNQIFGALSETLGVNNFLTDVGPNLGTYSDGWVSIGGEILPFIGGASQAFVNVVESAITVTYRDTTMNAVIITRKAVLDSSTGVPIGAFTKNTISSVKAAADAANAAAVAAQASASAAQAAAAAAQATANNAIAIAGSAGIPSGVIVTWSGSIGSIPSGFVLCDGGNGTPDLRDKFIPGAGLSYGVGSQGGQTFVTLATSHLPPHTHTVNGQTGGDNNDHSNNTRFAGGDKGVSESAFFFSIQSGSQGSGVGHENRPPYYALAFIMKT